jgi:hypothetical protein
LPAAAAAGAQARSEALRAELAATEAECEALRNEASVSLAHAAERDRLSHERALLDALGRQQADVIARQARRGALLPSARAAQARARAPAGAGAPADRAPRHATATLAFFWIALLRARLSAPPLARAHPLPLPAPHRWRTPPRLLRRTRRCARAWRLRACTWTL